VAARAHFWKDVTKRVYHWPLRLRIWQAANGEFGCCLSTSPRCRASAQIVMLSNKTRRLMRLRDFLGGRLAHVAGDARRAGEVSVV